jgi:hypothetical protein
MLFIASRATSLSSLQRMLVTASRATSLSSSLTSLQSMLITATQNTRFWFGSGYRQMTFSFRERSLVSSNKSPDINTMY